MTAHPFSEDALVQKTTADYLERQLGWEVVYAYNNETFGLTGLLGRKDERDVVLTRYLYKALEQLNPNLPPQAYDQAIREVIGYPGGQSILQVNEDKYRLLRDGVPVTFRNDEGEPEKRTLRVFDFEYPEKNHFLAVRELWIKGPLYRRRADIVGFVNGIPLVFMEVKNVHKDIKAAYEKNLADYRDTIPHLFHHNAVIVLGNGIEARIGSVSARFDHFHEWKRLAEEDPGIVDMETLLKGVCSKSNLMDLFESFILFDDSTGKTVKILARNHQYLGVNRAIESMRNRKERQGKLGVFWHTQGAGKSYSMVFFTRKIHRRLGANFTFVVLTDRDDLDTQIYKTFAGCGLVDHDRDPCRASSGEHLEGLLNEHKAYIFSLIQKFNREVDPKRPFSGRDDVIVISDEAHRTQYGLLSLNMRNALPSAGYIGFTGTPLFKDDEITRRYFGDYVSTYDFQRAVDDHATVPLYYDARGEKLRFVDDKDKKQIVATSSINVKIAEKLESLDIEDVNVTERLERELKREYHIITASRRLEQIARDFVEHYSTQWESGKAMLVCIDKVTCVRMYNLIQTLWQDRIRELEQSLYNRHDQQDEAFCRRQIDWMQQTLMAVVVSEEQGEVDRFRKWGLDIETHRRLNKEGFETPDGKRIPVDEAFKKADHPFRISIVCAMWLTGFDVQSLGTLYLDKPLKAHTLMQAIARANRVYEGKNNGLIVDYCGILRNLRKALATFAGHRGTGHVDGEAEGPEVDPIRPADEELLAELEETITLVRDFLGTQGFPLDRILDQTGFDRNAAIRDAKEAVNQNDETRKRFEIMAREVFKKFKACITLPRVNEHRHTYNAINIIYKSLQEDREKADITDIIRDLHSIVDEAIEPLKAKSVPDPKTYDISKIDFDRLRKEFERSPQKNTSVQCLKSVVENRLARMIQQNPLRMDLQRHYEEIIAAYNQEKDQVTIEKTFEELLRLSQSLDQETQRAVQEGLDEESLVLFDMLTKPDLAKKDIDRIKKVAQDLLARLKGELARIENWRARESTRDAIRMEIKDFLWNDQIGLPLASFTEDDVVQKAEQIYLHIFRVYDGPEPAIYAKAG